MAYTKDQESLKLLGVSEKFEPLFDNVFRGEDGGIYAAYGETMHLLAKNSDAYRIVTDAAKLPDDMAELQKKIYTPSTYGYELRMYAELLYVQWIGTNFTFVAESIYPHKQKVFVKSPTDYVELPEWNYIHIGGTANALICGGIPMIKEGDCYKIIELVPFIEVASNSTLYWAGNKDLMEIYYKTAGPEYRYFGSIEKFTQTAVSNLLEVKKDEGKYALYHLGERPHLIAYSPHEDGFKINKTTGTVVCNLAICSCGVQDITRTFVFKNGRYERQL